MQFGKNKPRFHGGKKKESAMSLTWYTHVRGYEWDGNGRGGQRVAGGKGVREREVSGCYSTRYKPQRDKMKGNTRRRRIRPNVCLVLRSCAMVVGLQERIGIFHS